MDNMKTIFKMDNLNKTFGKRGYFFLVFAILISLITCDSKNDVEPEPEPPEPLTGIEIVYGSVTDIDGNVYPTVMIGEQEWMAENLKTTSYRDGSAIDYPGANEDLWANTTAGAYAWYLNEEYNKDLYGAVYNWYAVSNPNGLCPAGWRVPTDSDWTGLKDHLITQYSLSNQEGVGSVGNRLKSCRQLGSPLTGCNTSANPRWNRDENHYGFDDFGFAALPMSRRSYLGDFFESTGTYGQWWSASAASANEALYRRISYQSGRIWSSSRNKSDGYAVRCVK
jgi:uncharacterized protein (TIGR02145 family)